MTGTTSPGGAPSFLGQFVNLCFSQVGMLPGPRAKQTGLDHSQERAWFKGPGETEAFRAEPLFRSLEEGKEKDTSLKWQ